MSTPTSEPFLKVRDLEVEFTTEDGKLKAVDKVSYDVHRGKTLAIVGESGSGKSVSSMAVMGLLNRKTTAIGGEVWLDGEELIAATDDRVRQLRGEKMAMIFQDPLSSLHPFYKIGKQLVEAVQVHQPLDKQAARARAKEMLDRVGIPDPEKRLEAYPHELSGGMRQRVMIAMALVNDPQMIIADEPTTALDVTVQAQIIDLLRDLQDDFGTAIVLITHDLGVVADMADEVLVMYGGRSVEQARAPRAVLPSADALHLGPAVLDAAHRHQPRAARADPRQPAVAAQAAQGLRVPSAVHVPRPGARRPVRHHPSRADRVRAGSPRPLPHDHSSSDCRS